MSISSSVLEDQEIISIEENNRQLLGKKQSSEKLTRYDSLGAEAAKLPGHQHQGEDWSMILHLAFQSLGIVYGDIGTSPLYVYAYTFPKGINHKDDVIAALSLIFYTLTLIPLIKYVLIVLRANDNGDGGTFALYSMLCRYTKVGLIPSQEVEDRDVSTFQVELPSNTQKRASKLMSILENSHFAKLFLLFATMLGTSMVIGDGVLAPSISVLSAVGGIKQATSSQAEGTSSMTEGTVVWVSVGILIALFMVQRFGTHKVGYCFAPIICIWFILIAGIGVYNFIKFDSTVIKALNPQYIIEYFERNTTDAWISLGGIILCTTGTEALFSDVGHFTVKSIQISMSTITYPALVLTYIGQAAFLRDHIDDVSDTFYKSVPGPMYWPVFVVAVMASIIASQAMISGCFSIVQQSLSLGCFPRVKVVHTSSKYAGQVYIPEINFLLMVSCVAVTLGFRTTVEVVNAYGIAVVFVMTLTSAFLVLIMIMIWKTHILLVISYIVVIGTVELVYLSSVIYKFDRGGYLPMGFATVLMGIMYTWNNVYRRKYYYELRHKIPPEKMKEIAVVCRIPGLAIFYSELVHGIPPIFSHYMENVPALHSVVVFVSMKSLPTSKVPLKERFLFRRVHPNELYVFRCVVRYGYADVRNEEEPFEKMLVERLKEFIREDIKFCAMVHNNLYGDGEEVDIERLQEEFEREMEIVDNAWQSGVVHLVGEQEVVAWKGASMVRKLLINYAYNFLKRNIRESDKVFDIPHKRMLKVGMTYEL